MGLRPVISGRAFKVIRIYLQLKKEEPMQVHQIRDGDVIFVLERSNSSSKNNNNNTEMSLEPHLNKVVVETTSNSSTEVITSEFFEVVKRR
jgi:hypothetical protein